jgi:hypothetical protein
LARAIPVLIGALAALLGIGGIAGKVKEVFQKIARPVNRAIDWVIDKIVGLFKKLWAKLKPKKKRHEKPGRPRRPGRPKRPKDRVSRRDNTPDGQRKRLRAAVAAGVRAVNRLSGRAIGRRLIEPVLTVIRVRYGLSVLRPVETERPMGGPRRDQPGTDRADHEGDRRRREPELQGGREEVRGEAGRGGGRA